MSPSAFYPGSFDPPTRGHVDLVRRGRELFDRVVIGVGENVHKAGLFSVAERVAMLEETFAELEGIEVVRFQGLTVEAARRHGCRAILRGLRDATDFAYEYPMTLTNRELEPAVETVFLMPSHEFSFVSSRLVKEVYEMGGEVARFLPAAVERRLREKFHG
ncbi:MAG: pantetheine-phosphate adenylyltransferase [Planctomycetota bacterium]